MLNLIAAARARRKPSSGRGFWLESDPMPKVLPGQGLGAGDDDVQELVADGPPDGDVFQPILGMTANEANQVGHESADTIHSLLAEKRKVEDAYVALCEQFREVRNDRAALNDANGRLAARIRTLEAQLRAAGIEPAARE